MCKRTWLFVFGLMVCAVAAWAASCSIYGVGIFFNYPPQQDAINWNVDVDWTYQSNHTKYAKTWFTIEVDYYPWGTSTGDLESTENFMPTITSPGSYVYAQGYYGDSFARSHAPSGWTTAKYRYNIYCQVWDDYPEGHHDLIASASYPGSAWQQIFP